ncbi:MAG: DUF962 domain-containing protein [Steroidobacter sp.]
MRTQQQYLSAYAQSHQNSLNQLIHYICVPVIAFSTLALLWAIPIGRWLGLDAGTAPWVNIVTLGILPVGAFYLRLSFRSFATMAVWYALSVVLIVLLQQSAGTTWLVAVAAILWIAAWALQFYGHEVEGAKPSFADDLVFLLIGPLFLMDKFYRRIGWGGL